MKPRTVEFTTAMLIRKPGCYMGKTALVAKYLSKCYKVQRVSARIFVNYLHIDVTSSACDSDSVRITSVHVLIIINFTIRHSISVPLQT